MARRKTTQEFVNDICRVNPNISIISEYRGCKEKIKCKCLIDGYEWEATPKKLLEGRGCPMCGGTLNLTNEQFAQRLGNINPNIIALDAYINARSKIRFKCLICGEIWSQDPNHILHQKTGCPKCKRLEITKDKEDFIKSLQKVNDKVILKGEYVNSYTKTLFECVTCGNQWYARPSHILSDLQGCPRCKQSKGEKQVEQFLQGGNIKYIPQYNIDSTSFTQSRVKVDFFLPELNCIIEYNGKQHYCPTDFGDNDQNKTLEKFNKQIIRDQQLRSFCKNNNIKLIEIPYTVPYKDIEQYLCEML